MLPTYQLTPRAASGKQEAFSTPQSAQAPTCALDVNGLPINNSSPSSPSRRLALRRPACCRRLSLTEGVLLVLLLLCGLAVLSSRPPSSPDLSTPRPPFLRFPWSSKDGGTAGQQGRDTPEDQIFRQLLAAAGDVSGELHNKGRTLQKAQSALAAHEELLAAEPSERRVNSIPPIIHQVYGLFHDASLPIEVPTSIRSFRQLNPDHTYLLWGAQDLDMFVEQYWPAFWPVYRRLLLPVLKADLSRYMLVHSFGGVYSDVDTRCLRPISQWSDSHENVSMIVGIEVDAYNIPDWHNGSLTLMGSAIVTTQASHNKQPRHWGRQLQISQWTFAAVPGHPILSHVLHRCLRLLTSQPLDKITEEDVTSVTGPSAFTDAVFDYMASKGKDWHTLQGQNQEEQIGDLYVLSITGFSPGVGHMGAEPISSPRAKVQHMFRGAWTTHREQDEGQSGTNHIVQAPLSAHGWSTQPQQPE